MKTKRVKVGDYVCTFGKVVAAHGTKQVVVRIGSVEMTLLRAEIWNPDHDVKPSRKK